MKINKNMMRQIISDRLTNPNLLNRIGHIQKNDYIQKAKNIIDVNNSIKFIEKFKDTFSDDIYWNVQFDNMGDDVISYNVFEEEILKYTKIFREKKLKRILHGD